MATKMALANIVGIVVLGSGISSVFLIEADREKMNLKHLEANNRYREAKLRLLSALVNNNNNNNQQQLLNDPPQGPQSAEQQEIISST